MSSRYIPPVSTGVKWLSCVISALPSLLLLFSASMKFYKPEGFAEGLEQMGWKESTMTIIGIVEVLCVVIYLIPQTAVVGAILIAAYMGGAIATHVRVGDAFFIQILVAVLAWLGLWLRDPRLRELAPLRRV